jgi:hypothetical protein
MKPFLSKAGETLRNQINASFPDRDKRSDGWIGDSRHAATKSDHNPASNPPGIVRAIDVDSDFRGAANNASYLADQLRILGKTDKRIAYVIFNKKIASPILFWKWRVYKGIDPHISHLHISFTSLGDADDKPFNIPMLGGK